MEISNPASPAQTTIFNSISEYTESKNPRALRNITKEAVTTSLFSSNPKVHGDIIADHIQNFFVDQGDGQAFLKGKSTEELSIFRKGLVNIMATDPSSRDALAPHLEMVNQVGQEKLAAQEHRAKETKFQSFPEFPEAPAFEKRGLSFKPSNMAAAAARVNIAEPKPLNESERVDALIDWAQKEAKKSGQTFSESYIPILRDHAESRTPEAFQQIVRNLLSMKHL
jgi:hypothetical protein